MNLLTDKDLINTLSDLISTVAIEDNDPVNISERLHMNFRPFSVPCR